VFADQQWLTAVHCSQCHDLLLNMRGRTQQQRPGVVQMQFQSRKTDLELFKERAEALQQAVVVLEEGITASRAQVTHYPPLHSF